MLYDATHTITIGVGQLSPNEFDKAQNRVSDNGNKIIQVFFQVGDVFVVDKPKHVLMMFRRTTIENDC